jgi:hypothetical protein
MSRTRAFAAVIVGLRGYLFWDDSRRPGILKGDAFYRLMRRLFSEKEVLAYDMALMSGNGRRGAGKAKPVDKRWAERAVSPYAPWQLKVRWRCRRRATASQARQLRPARMRPFKGGDGFI